MGVEIVSVNTKSKTEHKFNELSVIKFKLSKARNMVRDTLA